ncbi:MAG: hypothetical protein JSW28_02320 [Thermoplasmata archaeon]|nr:MAG: hypothetical protein JSW28_02320 [Thermoplasmata archaeon]
MPKDSKKKDFLIWGKIMVKETGQGIPNLMVRAFDRDLIVDDALGSARTDRNGDFRITYDKKAFKEFGFGKRPDIYLTISDLRGKMIKTTKDQIRYKAKEKEGFYVKISRELVRGIPLPKPKAQVQREEKKPEKAEEKKEKKVEAKAPKKVEKESIPLTQLPGVGPKRAGKLKAAGIEDVQAFAKTDDAELKKLLGNADIKKMKRECDKLLKKGKK